MVDIIIKETFKAQINRWTSHHNIIERNKRARNKALLKLLSQFWSNYSEQWNPLRSVIDSRVAVGCGYTHTPYMGGGRGGYNESEFPAAPEPERETQASPALAVERSLQSTKRPRIGEAEDHDDGIDDGHGCQEPAWPAIGLQTLDLRHDWRHSCTNEETSSML